MSSITKPVFLDETGKQISANLDAQNLILLRMADKMGAMTAPYTWAGLQAAVRAGIVHYFLSAGDQVSVDTNETVSAAVVGTGITAATVTKDDFLAAAGTEKHTYEFSFDGSAWHYEGSAVTLADYGISVAGTAAEGDAIEIHRTATAYDFDVLGINEDVPANPDLENMISIECHKVFTYGSIPYDPAHYLYPIVSAAWSSGLPAGKYKIKLDHGAYGGGTQQDGTYILETTQTTPAGGGVRHTTMGVYQSGGYTKAQITGGTWTTYAADTVTTVETGIVCREYDAATDTDAVDLGTTTGNNPTYKDGQYINFTERNAYGSNRWSTCYARQYLNSADAKLVWSPKTIWSRNATKPENAPEGFLHSIDPELRAVLAKVKTRYALSVADGNGYEDVEDYCKIPTLLDVFGQQNNSVSEGPVNSAGTVARTKAYTYWQDHNTNAERIKYLGTTASRWWLASCNPSHANVVRRVDASGALNYGYAYYAVGLAPSLFIA